MFLCGVVEVCCGSILFVVGFVILIVYVMVFDCGYWYVVVME